MLDTAASGRVVVALLGHDGLVEIAHSHVSSFPWNFSESRDARTPVRVATCIFISTPHCHDVRAPEEFSTGHVTRPIEDLLV